jgi:hypothetical protein
LNVRIWLREMFGTILLLGGLCLVALAVWFLSHGYILEGGALCFLSAVNLGAGTHLMKVALAVRVLMHEREAPR